jgi:copper resistance protein D
VQADLLHALPTAFDLLALALCLGALGGRLCVLPAARADSGTSGVEVILVPIWRLVVTSIVALSVSSLVELAGRSVEMSGRPLPAMLPLLPTILFHTHYGRAWLVRPIALIALWMGWWAGRRRLESRRIPALMFCAGALIAMMRSASGHAADWGDLTFSELIDWLHLMASALWGGGLLTLSIVVLPVVLKLSERRRLLADVARRFSILAGVALFVVLLTGLYNAWLQVGTIRAMWETPYGQTLFVKLLLVLLVLALGAANHYISVPLLQRWAGRPLPIPLPLAMWPVMRRLLTSRLGLRGVSLVRQFRRKVLAEGLFVVGILLCTALLLHGTPARHGGHMSHSARPHTPEIHADSQTLHPRHKTTYNPFTDSHHWLSLPLPVGEGMKKLPLVSPPPLCRTLLGHAFDDAELRRRVGGDDARQLETGAGEQGAIFRLSTVAPLIHD